MSARPAVVRYIEGHAAIDGRVYRASDLQDLVLYSNETFSTGIAKAEIQVLLTPGVFLRIGDNTAIRVMTPSQAETQFKLIRGEAMIEAAQLTKDADIEVVSRGAVIRIEKPGLYRIKADMPSAVSVFDGKAQVQIGAASQQVIKGCELLLTTGSKPQKINKAPDELYAWSKMRLKEEAAGNADSGDARSASPSSSSGNGLGNVASPGWRHGPQ